MNCKDALDLLYDIIDKEAKEIDSEEVKEHLENCRDCFKVFQVEESIQNLINEKVKLSLNDGVSPDKLDNLKSKIMNKLDDIDAEQVDNKIAGFLRMPVKLLVVAASLVIFVGAAFLSADLYRHNDHYMPIEKAHFAVLDNLDNFKTASADYNFSRQISGNIEGYTLIGVVLEEICNCSMDHAVFEKDGDLVSVFIVSASDFQIPEDLENSKIIENNVTYYDHNCRGCRLVFRKNGDKIYITASNNKELNFFQFSPFLAAI